jgi:hypothetical protein
MSTVASAVLSSAVAGSQPLKRVAPPPLLELLLPLPLELALLLPLPLPLPLALALALPLPLLEALEPEPPLPPVPPLALSLSPQAASVPEALARQRIETQAACRIKKPFPKL